jgi:hypothetical protein
MLSAATVTSAAFQRAVEKKACRMQDFYRKYRNADCCFIEKNYGGKK